LAGMKEQEFAAVYERQADAVYRACYLYFYNRKSDLEDAFQSAFLQLICKNPLFRDEGHERAWLIVTASNICKNMLGSAWNRKITGEEAVPVQGQEDPLPDEMLGKVLGLPEKYKTAIYLYYYEGYSAKEIAQAMGKSENSVWSYLHKGRRMLRVRLEEEQI